MFVFTPSQFLIPHLQYRCNTIDCPPRRWRSRLSLETADRDMVGLWAKKKKLWCCHCCTLLRLIPKCNKNDSWFSYPVWCTPSMLMVMFSAMVSLLQATITVLAYLYYFFYRRPCWNSITWWFSRPNICLYHWYSIQKLTKMWSFLVWKWQSLNSIYRSSTCRNSKSYII